MRRSCVPKAPAPCRPLRSGRCDLDSQRWDANMSSLASVDAADVRTWFEEYLGVFAACGRGDNDELRTLLAYYGVPLLPSTDDAAVALKSDDELLNALRRQMDGMRADGYDRSEMLSSDFAPINRTSVGVDAAPRRRHRWFSRPKAGVDRMGLR